MSRNYDNWERLVSAVLRREQYRQLCYAPSLSSGFSSSFRSTSSFSINPSFDFADPQRAGLLPFGISSRFMYFDKFDQIHKQIQGKSTAKRLEENKKLERLVFVEDSPFGFGVQTLLTAPSRNLGEEVGSFCQSFLLSLGLNFLVVMRRMQGVLIWRKNFEGIMKMIGSINHENLVNLRGYYSEIDTSVFGIYDYFSRGSLATMLYGKRDPNEAGLEWDARIRIAIGAARGLAHIHRQCGGKLVHGNLKASNILINSEGYGCVADFHLENLLNPSNPTVTRNRGYSHPEKLTLAPQASDVYSFGVILFELLGGKSPELVIYSQYGDWARHKARDDWTALVFDRGLLKDSTMKGEMQDMLHVALSCVKDPPHKRISMEEVVNMLESIV